MLTGSPCSLSATRLRCRLEPVGLRSPSAPRTLGSSCAFLMPGELSLNRVLEGTKLSPETSRQRLLVISCASFSAFSLPGAACSAFLGLFLLPRVLDHWRLWATTSARFASVSIKPARRASFPGPRCTHRGCSCLKGPQVRMSQVQVDAYLVTRAGARIPEVTARCWSHVFTHRNRAPCR